jgi:LemA protein
MEEYFMKKGGFLLIGLLVLLGFWLMGFYNRLVSSNEQVDTQWAQVQNAYQRRFDLIPNLVETVKGISQQEQEVFGAIAEARTRYAGAVETGSSEEQLAATNQLESSLGRLLVIMENYPELRSSESYQTLMAQLEGTENRINVERNRFNETVREYNLITKRFPGNMLASLFGYSERAYFEAAGNAQDAPQVDFSE